MLSIISTSCYAQISVPDSNSIWRYDEYNSGGSFVGIRTDSIGLDDTLISSNTYSKLYSNAVYDGGIRSTSVGEVYYVHAWETSELLIFDFSASIGDTVFNVYGLYHNVYNPGEHYDGVILAIDSFYYNSEYQRVFTVEASGAPGTTVEWIEVIGGGNGLRNNMWGSVSGDFLYRDEMCYADTAYPSFEPIDTLAIVTCGELLNIAEIEQSSLAIFPNPTNGFVFLDVANVGNARITVYDISGSIILEEQITAGEISHELDLSSAEPGMYLLIVRDDRAVYSAKVVRE